MATLSYPTVGAASVELPLRQFDADQYMAMSGAGVFEEGRRVELIGGYIIDMAPANPDHNYVIMRFNRLFAPLMASFEFWVQGTLRVDRRNVFDPDFMLLQMREQSYKLALPRPADVALVVEVAGSSMRRDAGIKMPLYAEHGIGDYWIADLDREVLVVNRNPAGKDYADKQEFAAGASIAPLAAPDFTIAVADIFN